MQNCLLIGGSGFIGMNLCKVLLNNGYNVVVASRRGIHSARLKELFCNIRFLPIDFTADVEWREVLSDIDIVYHMISTTTPANKNLLYDFSSNVLPTIRLLDACVEKSVKLIYFSSGGTVYGLPRYLPIDEKHRTEPISAYGIHKLSIEKCIEYYGRTYGLNYYILRIANLYGAYQDFRRNQGAVAVFLSKIFQKKTIEVWGTGSAIRDYIYIDDLMDCCLKLMNYTGGEKVFNIGSGRGYSLVEVLDLLKSKIEYKFQVNYLPSRIQDVSANVLDVSLAEKELEWHPKVCLYDGIDRMIDLWNIESFEFNRRFLDN